jgi:hypothetical protein
MTWVLLRRGVAAALTACIASLISAVSGHAQVGEQGYAYVRGMTAAAERCDKAAYDRNRAALQALIKQQKAGSTDQFVLQSALNNAQVYPDPCRPRKQALQQIGIAEVGIVGGLTNFSGGGGTFSSHDVITTDRDQRNQPYTGTNGVLGLFTTIYGPNVPISAIYITPLFRTGFLENINSSRTESFNTLGDNTANGKTKVTQSWSVPLLAGFDTSLPIFGQDLHLQVSGGAMIDRRTASFQLNEIATNTPTTGSVSTTQVNPAFDIGLREAIAQANEARVSVGVDTIIDFQRPINKTVQSAPYFSMFYTQDTGRQIAATILFSVDMVFLSDARLKREVVMLRRLANGLGLYRYRYLWSDQVYVGVMAQEVAQMNPHAVVHGDDGYLRVNYARLGLRLQTWEDWKAAQ